MGEELKQKNSGGNFMLATAVSLLVNAVYWAVCLQPNIQDSLSQKSSHANLVLMIGSALLYLITMIVSRCIIKRSRAASFMQSQKKGAFFIFCAVLCACFIGIGITFINATELYASTARAFYWHQIPFGILAVMAIAGFIAFYYFTGRFQSFSIPTAKKRDFGFLCVVVLMALIIGYATYFPNALAERNIFHFDAYYNSVYNVYYGAPFSEAVNSVYGHYGLLLAPVLKVVSFFNITNILNAFTLLMSILNVLAFLLMAYALSVFVKNKTLRYAAVVAMALTLAAMRDIPYLQVHPHRTIVIGVVVALITAAVRHPGKIRIITVIGYILCAVMIVWNTEMGIIATAAWAVFLIVHVVQRYRNLNTSPAIKKKPNTDVFSAEIQVDKKYTFKTRRYLWSGIVLNVLAAFICFIAAVGIVNLYNAANGGAPLTVSQFIFPLNSQYYMSDVLELPLPIGLNAWLPVLALLLGFGVFGLFSLKNAEAPNSSAWIGISVMGLGAMTYYINRPAYYNLDIIYMIIVLLACVFIQYCFPAMKALHEKRTALTLGQGIMSALGFAAAFVIVMLAVGCVTNIGYSEKENRIYKDKEALEESATEVGAIVPEGTKAIGMGTAELYSLLGRNTDTHTMDMPDLRVSEGAVQDVREKLNSVGVDEGLFVNGDVLEWYQTYFPEDYDRFIQSHRLAHTFDNQIRFCYYEPV